MYASAAKSAFGLAMTLNFDILTLKRFSALPIYAPHDEYFVPRFIQGRLIQWARWARAQGPQASGGPQIAHALVFIS